MIGQKHTIAHLQSDFYRDKFRRLLRALIIASWVILLLTAIIIYLILFATPRQYYATTTTGQIISMQPVKQPSDHTL